MKRAVNFRLSNRATTALSVLESVLHSSKTEIVENAIQFYAKKQLSHQDSILKFAGILNNNEAESMLEAIEMNKHNKDIEIDL